MSENKGSEGREQELLQDKQKVRYKGIGERKGVRGCKRRRRRDRGEGEQIRTEEREGKEMVVRKIFSESE